MVKPLSIEICVRFDVGSPTSGRSPLTEVRPLSAQRTAHTQDKVEPSQDLTWLQGVHCAHFALATRRTYFSCFATDAVWCFLTNSTPKKLVFRLINTSFFVVELRLSAKALP